MRMSTPQKPAHSSHFRAVSIPRNTPRNPGWPANTANFRVRMFPLLANRRLYL